MKRLLTLDIGGTNTRAACCSLNSESTFVPGSDVSEEVATRAELLEFLERYTAGHGTPDAAVLSFAGVVNHRANARMTNWAAPNELSAEDIAGVGIPGDRVLFVNDMTAAAYGVIACGSSRHDAAPPIENLYVPSEPSPTRPANMIVLVPGTGIGVAGIVPFESSYAVVPCELQHAPVAPLDDAHRVVVESMKERLGVERVDWEDFISGAGLECLYDILPGADGERGKSAARIAGDAVSSRDPASERALDMYYFCLGGLAQIVALTFQPFGGIYLAGRSTARNSGFIRRSRFMSELHNNPTHGNLLKQFPVRLIHDDVNLRGAAYIGWLEDRARTAG